MTSILPSPTKFLFLFIHSFILLFAFDIILLYKHACPRNHNVDQDDIKLAEICLLLSSKG